MPEPTFSVVVAAFNAAETVGSAIQSVLAQTRPDFELIVVDDGSQDGTAERVRALQNDRRVRLLRLGHLGAPAPVRNAGIAAARGSLISILDADDLLLPTYLEAMGDALATTPEAGMAYTDAYLLDDASGRVQRPTAMRYQDPPIPPPADPSVFLAHLIERNFILASATVRRSVIQEVGPFDERLAAAEDYELWLRLAARGWRAVRPPGLLAVYRKMPGTLSTDAVRTYEALRDIYRLMLAEYELQDQLRARVQARLVSVERMLAGASRRSVRATARYEARRLAVSSKRALLRPYYLRRTPPPELRAAFPDLWAG